MGHLINPIAFRLGFTRSWEDSWFVKNIYYPEFLHSILKIRNYIYYFWTTRYMEKKGFLLSHLYIYKFIKNLLIKIFLYNTDIEKYTYTFFAKGSGIFSDAIYYRLKKNRERKKAFFFERYKPDFFFIIFLYSYFFLKKNMNIKKKNKKKGFTYFYNIKKKKIKNNEKYKKIDKIFKSFYRKNYNRTNEIYLENLKSGNLNFFFKTSNGNKEHIIIPKYEENIQQLRGQFNMGFFDFVMYLFFKINTLEKEKEDILCLKTKRKHLEMIINYPVKIKRLILLLKKYINLNIKLSDKVKKSIKNFLFFLIFIIEFLSKIKKNRTKFKLRDLNLKLIRLLFFNKILVGLSFFFGEFLRHILYLLTNIRKYSFRFCFLSNASLNAKFLTRYISLKLKRKFPLFFVINPIKKELKKLFLKKREKRFSLFFNLYELKNKNKFVNIMYSYKEGFKNILLYLYKKYIELCIFYYNKQKTLITFDFYIYFLILRNKYKNQMLLKKKVFNFFLRKKLKKYIKIKKKKNIYLNYKWIKLLKKIINYGFSFLKNFFLRKKFVFTKLYLFIKNKLLISLFFGSNKYNIDALAHIFFNLRFNKYTFFYINIKFINLFMYNFFNNYIFLNFNTLSYVNSKYLMISNYFFKSFMYYNYTLYSFNKFINYLNINKKKNYQRMKNAYKISSFIMGFKMSFKGRFSRKQRASSVWFHQGYVPLNTVKAIIDYAFFTIPLKNSAISVKLWLYKNTEITHWHYKFYDDMKITIN